MDIDNTLLTALNTIAAKKAAVTKQTEDQWHRFLDCNATKPNISLIFQKVDMDLTIYSYASYLVEPQACSSLKGFRIFSTK